MVLEKRLDSDLMQLEGFINFRLVIFQKMSGKIIDLSGKCPGRLSNFCKKIRLNTPTVQKNPGTQAPFPHASCGCEPDRITQYPDGRS
jgi:hypothetical protein